jgi:hypothetical protein
MAPENGFLDEIERTVGDGLTWSETLARILEEMSADSGTIHLLGDDGVLHLKAASAGIPQIVLDTIKDVPVGKGMAALLSSVSSRSTPATSRLTRAATSAQARSHRAAGIGRCSTTARRGCDRRARRRTLRERTFTGEEGTTAAGDRPGAGPLSLMAATCIASKEPYRRPADQRS